MNTLQEPETTQESREQPARAEADPGTLTLPTGIFRFWLRMGVTVLALYAYWSAGIIGPRGQALCGILVILGLVALFSRDLAAVSWRPLFFGFGLQIFIALFIMKFEITGLES